MPDNIFVKKLNEEPLDAFAGEIFGLLDVTQVEERSSLSYVHGRYFVGSSLGLTLTVAEADEKGFEDYEFWLSLKIDGLVVADTSFLEGCGDVIARILTLKGYDVARPFSLEDWLYERPVVKRILYVREHGTADKAADRISTLVDEKSVG